MLGVFVDADEFIAVTISLLLSYNTPGDQHGYAMLDAANVLARVPGLTPTLIDAARALIAAQRLSIARATDGRIEGL